MSKEPSNSIRISAEVKAKLLEIAHPGQSYDGVIRELLEKTGSTVIKKTLKDSVTVKQKGK